jgi:anaerobic dimethyl sulfoxide reductase subunit B (iron-sulfur subunit)
MQYAFYFDQTRCSGCDTCTVSCKDWNGVKAGPVKWRKKYDLAEKGTFPNVKVSYLVYSCNHCKAPACVAACPVGAIIKETSTGFVLVDKDRCQSLGECVKKCPYGAISLADDKQETAPHKAQKCTFCYDRIEANKKPICVSACPNRALDFGGVEYIMAKYPHAQRALDVDGFPGDTIGSDGTTLVRPTIPNLFVKAK